jgi:hypothetical protein
MTRYVKGDCAMTKYVKGDCAMTRYVKGDCAMTKYVKGDCAMTRYVKTEKNKTNPYTRLSEKEEQLLSVPLVGTINHEYRDPAARL